MHTHRSRRFRKRLCFAAAALGACLVAGCALVVPHESDSKAAAPWWQQEKIRFMWGQWSRFEGGGIPMSAVIENLAAVGGTVFVEDGQSDWRHAFLPERRAACRKYGLRHLGMVKACNAVYPANDLQARPAIDQMGRTAVEAKASGEPAWATHFADWAPVYVACPLEERVLEEWLAKPALECAENGLDGMHIDWEPYATSMDGTGSWLCFCDDCFAKFLQKRGRTETVAAIPAAKRSQWLQAEGLWREYFQVLHDRYRDVFRGIAIRVRKIKPDFIFSAYSPFMTPGWLDHDWRRVRTRGCFSSL